jgi:hypothetical protein
MPDYEEPPDGHRIDLGKENTLPPIATLSVNDDSDNEHVEKRTKTGESMEIDMDCVEDFPMDAQWQIEAQQNEDQQRQQIEEEQRQQLENQQRQQIEEEQRQQLENQQRQQLEDQQRQLDEQRQREDQQRQLEAAQRRLEAQRRHQQFGDGVIELHGIDVGSLCYKSAKGFYNPDTGIVSIDAFPSQASSTDLGWTYNLVVRNSMFKNPAAMEALRSCDRLHPRSCIIDGQDARQSPFALLGKATDGYFRRYKTKDDEASKDFTYLSNPKQLSISPFTTASRNSDNVLLRWARYPCTPDEVDAVMHFSQVGRIVLENDGFFKIDDVMISAYIAWAIYARTWMIENSSFTTPKIVNFLVPNVIAEVEKAYVEYAVTAILHDFNVQKVFITSEGRPESFYRHMMYPDLPEGLFVGTVAGGLTEDVYISRKQIIGDRCVIFPLSQGTIPLENSSSRAFNEKLVKSIKDQEKKENGPKLQRQVCSEAQTLFVFAPSVVYIHVINCCFQYKDMVDRYQVAPDVRRAEIKFDGYIHDLVERTKKDEEIKKSRVIREGRIEGQVVLFESSICHYDLRQEIPLGDYLKKLIHCEQKSVLHLVELLIQFYEDHPEEGNVVDISFSGGIFQGVGTMTVLEILAPQIMKLDLSHKVDCDNLQVKNPTVIHVI